MPDAARLGNELRDRLLPFEVVMAEGIELEVALAADASRTVLRARKGTW